MSDKIIDALSKGFVARLRWWAFFTASGGVPLATSLSNTGEIGGIQGPRVPLMLGLVHDTETAIDALPARYAQVVKQFWLFEGRPLRWHARHRGINHETFGIWVMKGHELLRVEFARARARWELQVEHAESEITPEMHRIRVHNRAREARDIA